MNRGDLQHLSSLRLREAETLLAAGEYSGAYYLAGYAVECALKASIARRTREFDFPDRQVVLESYVHDPAKLLKAARLTTSLEAAMREDLVLRTSWDIVLDWSEGSRYRVIAEDAARAMLYAVNDTEHGVLRWITQFW